MSKPSPAVSTYRTDSGGHSGCQYGMVDSKYVHTVPSGETSVTISDVKTGIVNITAKQIRKALFLIRIIVGIAT